MAGAVVLVGVAAFVLTRGGDGDADAAFRAALAAADYDTAARLAPGGTPSRPALVQTRYRLGLDLDPKRAAPLERPIPTAPPDLEAHAGLLLNGLALGAVKGDVAILREVCAWPLADLHPGETLAPAIREVLPADPVRSALVKARVELAGPPKATPGRLHVPVVAHLVGGGRFEVTLQLMPGPHGLLRVAALDR